MLQVPSLCEMSTVPGLKGSVSTQGHPRSSSLHKEIHVLQGNKEQGLRDKNLKQRMREKGKRTKERGQGELS